MDYRRMALWLVTFITIFSVIQLAYVSAQISINGDSESNNVINLEPSLPPPFNNATANVNSSDYWCTEQGCLNNVNDITQFPLWYNYTLISGNFFFKDFTQSFDINFTQSFNTNFSHVNATSPQDYNHTQVINQDDNWVNITGDVMTGSLNISVTGLHQGLVINRTPTPFSLPDRYFTLADGDGMPFLSMGDYFGTTAIQGQNNNEICIGNDNIAQRSCWYDDTASGGNNGEISFVAGTKITLYGGTQNFELNNSDNRIFKPLFLEDGLPIVNGTGNIIFPVQHNHGGNGTGFGEIIPHETYAPTFIFQTNYTNNRGKPIRVWGNFHAITNVVGDSAYIRAFLGNSELERVGFESVGFRSGSRGYQLPFTFTVGTGETWAIYGITAGSGTINMDNGFIWITDE